MLLLSANLLHSCRELLLECRQFASDESLKAFFVTQELYQFEKNLPEAKNSSDRVDFLIRYLLDKKTHSGESVFIIFLNTLCIHFSSEDDLYVRLRSLRMEIEIEYLCQSSFLASIKEALSVNMSMNASIEPEMLTKFVKNFLKFPQMRSQSSIREIMDLLPQEITCAISYDEQVSEIRASLQLVQACAGSPDGLEKLAYALYKKERNITPQWLELDAFMRGMSKTVVTYARLQQLREILLSAQCWSMQMLKHAYRVSNPLERIDLLAISKHSDPLPLMLSMLDDLASFPLQSDGTIPLFVFVLNLYGYAQQQQEKGLQVALYRWINERFEEYKFDDHQNVIHQRKADEQQFRASYHLLIMLEPESRGLFWIRAWLLDSNNAVYPDIHVDCEDKAISLELVPGILSALLDQCAGYLLEKLEKLVVEFLLPNELLYHPVDTYPVNSGMKDVKLGIQYQVVVRSLERLLNKKGKMHAFWKSKWETLERLLDGQREGESTSVWIGEKDHGETYESLYSTLIDSAIVAQALTYVPLGNDFDDVVSATLAAGIPVALWPRVKTDSPQTVANFLSSLLSSDRLPSLPDFIWKQRVEAGRSKDSHHQGHYWTLLWDNPNRFPEDAPQLSMPPVRKGV